MAREFSIQDIEFIDGAFRREFLRAIPDNEVVIGDAIRVIEKSAYDELAAALTSIRDKTILWRTDEARELLITINGIAQKAIEV